jgi:hypothetical protein
MGANVERGRKEAWQGCQLVCGSAVECGCQLRCGAVSVVGCEVGCVGVWGGWVR